MLCDDVKRVIYFFLDGSLSDQKRQNIEIHLHDCADCETRVTIHRDGSVVPPCPFPERA